MDQPTPDPTPAPAAPAPERTRDERVSARLRTLVPDERVVAWAQGWVSREVRWHGLLAARTLDFAVVTDRSFYLFSTGFFSRRVRRCVFSAPLDGIFVSDESVPSGGRRLRLIARSLRPLWIELRADERTKAFAGALLARSRAVQP